MKNHLLVLLFCLFSTQLNWAQIKYGEIIYKIEAPTEFNDFIDSTITKKYSESTSDYLKHLHHQVKKAAPYVRFKLVFNQEASLYKAEENMDKDDGLKISSAIGLSGGKGLFYTNTSKNQSIQQQQQFNKLWRIERQTDTIDWALENEYKTIQGYQCQKATATYAIDPEKSIKLIAWFTPELPFHFGPNGISGLPGAILGLDYNSFYIYAHRINLSKKERKIEAPTKGELMTLEEFDKIVLKNNPLEKESRSNGQKKKTTK